MKKIKLSSDFSYLYLLAGFLFAAAVYYAFLDKVQVDEIEGIHTAWKILQGEVIYHDFFQHHHPLFYYALIPIIQIGGETITTFYLTEIFQFLILTGIVAMTFLLAEKIYNDRKIAWFSVILLLTFPFFITEGTRIRPDFLQILLGLLSVYFLVIYLKNEGTKKYFFGSAILLSLSFLVLQKAIFLIFVIGIFLLYLWFKKNPKITTKDFIFYWTVFSILPALYAIFLLASGDWQNYFDFNWLLNMKYQDSISAFKHFSLDVSSRKFPITFIMAGFVFLFAYAFKTGKIDHLRGLMILTGVVLTLSLFLVRMPHAHYFPAMAPFFALIAAFSLRHLFSERAAKTWLAVFATLCALSVLLPIDSSRKKLHISELRYALSISDPEDRHFGHYRNLFRRDADFFWFCVGPSRCTGTYSGFRNYDFDHIRIIRQTRPEVVYVPHGGFGFSQSAIKYLKTASNYEKSSEYPRFYIRKDD